MKGGGFTTIQIIKLAFCLAMFTGCSKEDKDPGRSITGMLSGGDTKVGTTQAPPRVGLVVFIGQSNTPCVARYGVDSFLTVLSHYTSMKINTTVEAVGGTWSYNWQRGDYHYETAVQNINSLIALNGVKPVAIVYVQGENEATTNTVDWKTNFETFARTIREDIHAQGIPVIWERESNLLAGLPPATYLNEQRDAQMMANVTPGRWVNVDDIPIGNAGGDGVHYNATQCPAFAERFGDTLGPYLH